MNAILENKKRHDRGERLTIEMLEAELTLTRQLFAENTDKKRAFHLSQHIATLEAAIQYRKNHPLK